MTRTDRKLPGKIPTAAPASPGTHPFTCTPNPGQTAQLPLRLSQQICGRQEVPSPFPLQCFCLFLIRHTDFGEAADLSSGFMPAEFGAVSVPSIWNFPQPGSLGSQEGRAVLRLQSALHNSQALRESWNLPSQPWRKQRITEWFELERDLITLPPLHEHSPLSQLIPTPVQPWTPQDSSHFGI